VTRPRSRRTSAPSPTRFTLVLAGVAALALLAGCGSSSKSDDAKTTGQTSKPPVSKPAAGQSQGNGTGTGTGTGTGDYLGDPRFDVESACGLADSINFQVYVSGNLTNKTAAQKQEIGNTINEKADKLSASEPDLAPALDSIVSWEADHLNGGDQAKPEAEIQQLADYVDECVKNK